MICRIKYQVLITWWQFRHHEQNRPLRTNPGEALKPYVIINYNIHYYFLLIWIKRGLCSSNTKKWLPHTKLLISWEEFVWRNKKRTISLFVNKLFCFSTRISPRWIVYLWKIALYSMIEIKVLTKRFFFQGSHGINDE